MAKINVSITRSQAKLAAECLTQAGDALAKAGLNGRTLARVTKLADTLESAAAGGGSGGGD